MSGVRRGNEARKGQGRTLRPDLPLPVHLLGPAAGVLLPASNQVDALRAGADAGDGLHRRDGNGSRD